MADQPEYSHPAPGFPVLVVFHHPPYPRMIGNIVYILRLAVLYGDTLAGFNPEYYRPWTAYHSPYLPFIDLRSYLERIFRYFGCSPDCYVYAYIYLTRFFSRHLIHSLNIHCLLLTSIVVAVRIVNGRIHSNAYFADVGGVGRTQMDQMELRFNFDIDFNWHVNPSEFAWYSTMLWTYDLEYNSMQQLF